MPTRTANQMVHTRITIVGAVACDGTTPNIINKPIILISTPTRPPGRKINAPTILAKA